MTGKAQTKTPGTKPPAFPFVQVAVSGLLIVVEATLARFVIALATRPVGRTLVPSSGPGDFAAATAIETAASRRRTAGEVGASIAHRAAVATAAGASAAVTTAATAAAVTAAAATVAAATTAAAIATATAATVAATTTASAVGRTRTARTEAATIATAATAAAESAAATTTGLTFDSFADGNRSTIEQRAVHGLHGRGALIICFHLEEGEATAAAGLAIHDHF
jgi:hypothetical protein